MSDRWTGLLADTSGKRDQWRRYVDSVEEKIHAFLQFDPQLDLDSGPARGALSGVPFAVKDNIAVSGFKLTCGSRLLKDFVSPYTATVVEKLQGNGAVVVGKTNLDEFGMGSSTENSALAKTHNPWDLGRVPGGSSGGSAAAVAAGLVPFALGSDTGGSIRQPASFCGVYGLKPTYGAVSRYGLVAYASSLEVIGIITRSVSWSQRVFDIIRGQDPRDHSSVPYESRKRPSKRLNVGVLSLDAMTAGESGISLHPDVEKSLQRTRSTLQDLDCTVREIELPLLDYLVSAYYTIAAAEASANLARFDGVRYGQQPLDADNPEELVRMARSRGLGDEVKLRILLGTFVLRSGFQDQYYLRAQKIRTAIRRDFDRAFSQVDLILMPVYPCPAFKPFDESDSPDPETLDAFSQKLSDIYTCSANLAGLPAMSSPVAVENGLPIGMQFVAPAFGENILFEACGRYEEQFPAPASPFFSRQWEL